MSLLTNPEDLKQDLKFKGLIYGQPGIGKSTLSLSAPHPVCIDADRGMMRVEPQLRAPSLQVKSYQEILNLLNSDEIAPFETLVFDTIGEVLTFMEPYLIAQNPKNAKTNGSLSLQGYGERKKEFKDLLKRIQAKGKSVLFVAHEKEEKDGENKIIRPDIGGSSGADIIKLLDFVGYMEAKGSKRTISFYPTEKYYAKNSLRLDDVIEVPDTSNGNTFIAERIVKVTSERLNQQAELREKYNKIIESAEATIKKNGDKFNATIDAFKEFETVWDSKKRIFSMLNESAKAAGYHFNKETSLFEQTKKEPEKATAEV